MKFKLTNKYLKNWRLRILEPSPSILDALKDYWEKNNIDTNIYGEWDKVSVEVEGEGIEKTPALIYFFDEYETIPYNFTTEEINDIDDYLFTALNSGNYPDNYVLGLGDVEYEELVDTIDKKHNIDVKEYENNELTEPDITDDY